MEIKLLSKLKLEYQKDNRKYVMQNDIPVFINPQYLQAENQKYMKMYNWMAPGYDLAEKVIGWIKYGNSIKKMRTELMRKLEWKNHCSVLYVSIGTGTDLDYIPAGIDKLSLDINGIDLSIGMLKKCERKYKHQFKLSLVNGMAEDLPFKDNEFDIVFHVGGINFFEDKRKAITEMIRVAKNGSKLLIADETQDFIDKQYKKSALSKKYFKEAQIDLNEIEMCVPETMLQKQTTLLWDNRFYCITFKKGH